MFVSFDLWVLLLLGVSLFTFTILEGTYTPHSGLPVPCAIKKMKTGEASNHSTEIIEEADVMAALQHPCIVRLIGLCASVGMHICMSMRVRMYVHASMHACMYVRTYVCMYVCMYVCIYVLMYVCVCVCLCLSVCLSICLSD